MMLPILLLGAWSQSQTVDLIPTDDIWVYPHAGDPAKDAYLRAWGSDGKSVAGKEDSVENFSYSYLRFSLTSIKSGSKLEGATLTLFYIPNEELTPDIAKQSPIEVRALVGDFSEKGWSYDQVAKIAPAGDTKALFGRGWPDKIEGDKPIEIKIDLMKEPSAFGDNFLKALAGNTLELAITSKIDPSEAGRGAVYKFYSKDGPKEYRPYLSLKFKES